MEYDKIAKTFDIDDRRYGYRRGQDLDGLRSGSGAGTWERNAVDLARALDARVLLVAGSGHDDGLCQWGARLQADKGRSYTKIMTFYFPGAELSEVDE